MDVHRARRLRLMQLDELLERGAGQGLRILHHNAGEARALAVKQVPGGRSSIISNDAWLRVSAPSADPIERIEATDCHGIGCTEDDVEWPVFRERIADQVEYDIF